MRGGGRPRRGHGLRIGFFDPVKQFLGTSLDELLASLLRSPPTDRTGADGRRARVYPLALPDGDGVALPLAEFGELGFRADGDRLVLSVPPRLEATVLGQWGDLVTAGPVRRASATGRGVVSDLWLRLVPGSVRTVPVWSHIVIAVEVPA